MTKIKICGIRDIRHAVVAYEEGADYLGFVFAKSKRQVTPDQAKEIIAALPSDIEKVGVFVNQPYDQMKAIADFCGLTILQLHGQETYGEYAHSMYPIIKSVSVKPSDSSTHHSMPKADYLLFDTWHQKMAGGCGKTFDWNYLENYTMDTPFFLAGGLHCQNVQQAVKKLNPYAVDVSSGVETDGHKDSAKIKTFIKQVKECHRDDL